MNIITLTLSPAIDIHCHAERFSAEHENFAKICSRDAGGKGINLSRALLSYGVKSTAIVAVGTENGDSFLSLLSKDGIDCRAICTKGSIRENITIHTKEMKETRLSFEGFCGDARLIEKVEDTLNEIVQSDDIVALTGSIPTGISIEDVKALIFKIKQKGASVVIDSRSFNASDIVECAPFLIKPNEEEITVYAGKEVSTVSEATEIGKVMSQSGIKNVMISLGGKGAVLARGSQVFFAKAPKIEVLSTIGAGDSSIAGFLVAYKDGKSAEECLKTAVAFGSAACMTEGTKPPKKEIIEQLLGEIKIEKL